MIALIILLFLCVITCDFSISIFYRLNSQNHLQSMH